jgi:D-aspartate ligase
MRRPATVIIGDHTQGLGILRSAARAGGEIWVVNDKTVSLARCSKYLTGYKRVPRGTFHQLDQRDAADGLLTILLELPVESPALLCGVNEDIVGFIYAHRAQLGHRYAIPNVRLDTIFDKYVLNTLLPESLRIDTRLCSRIDLDAFDAPQRFILKGRQGNAFRRATGRKAIRLDRLSRQDRADLFTRISADQVVVQELIESDRPVASVCTFSIDGESSGVFAYEKLRQHPADFGTGTCLRSIGADALLPLAEGVLKQLNFTGISEIEFVSDRRTDSYKVVEINPRTWKSIYFSTQCGQNLVEQYLRYLAGAPMRATDGYTVGRYWIDLATDLPQMIRQRTLFPWARGFYECTWDSADLLPALALWTLFPLIAIENHMASPSQHLESRVRIADQPNPETLNSEPQV